MGGDYCQAPYGDFWTDSGGANFCFEKLAKIMETSRGPKADFVGGIFFVKVDHIWQLSRIRLRQNTHILIIFLSRFHPNLV